MYKTNGIMSVSKNEKNDKILNNYLITGTEKNIKFDLEEDAELYKIEDQFGIITYSKPFKYGKIQKLSCCLTDIQEPIRMLIDENIFRDYQNNIKELIVLNTEKDSICVKEYTFEQLLENFIYKSKYSNYNEKDIQRRYLPLPAKYEDARFIYQKYNDKKQLLNLEQRKVFNWYSKHIKFRSNIFDSISRQVNILFENDTYFYQEKHPLRFNINNSLGTPVHLDTCRLLINEKDRCKYRLCENDAYYPIDKNQGYIETKQDSSIMNINYTIYDTNPENSLRICNIQYDNMLYEKCSFFRLKQNYPNEIFIWNASKYLHFKPYNMVDISIRGDMRILPKSKYDFNRFKLYRGPRCNLEVSFCISQDKEKLKDDKVKYCVF